ncbi:hypothetical protein FACS1894172_01370 [Spirochaetia bacterium]|nr:hypothetical protein FACS1894164_04810 [Spirochaetia bacterium]GHU29698.1 hypothetical protein FACS1894172_01370 [Spirochaetia bacterium]
MTKQDLIAAAFRVWGRKLYQSTSLSDLARELQVTKAALYRHIKDKQELLDAMFDNFFDEYVLFIKPHYDRALSADTVFNRYLIMARAIIEYYVVNRDAFIFSLINVYGNRKIGTMGQALRARGVDMLALRIPGSTYPDIVQLMSSTVIFWVAYFHRLCPNSSIPSKESVQALLLFAEKNLGYGLGVSAAAIDRIDHEHLEQMLSLQYGVTERLLRAVASEVAESGPWNVSMENIAKRSGLSKSSLYSHFQNKQDMLGKLFTTELGRIAHCARSGLALSDIPEEQLYAAIFSIADYLRERPEILATIDWIRTRYVHINIPGPHLLFFAGIAVSGTGEEMINHWILFLIVNTLMHSPDNTVSNGNIRILFRFICLGISGFSAPVPV